MIADPDEGPRRDAPALEAALGALGVRCAVEARGGLAVLVPSGADVGTLISHETRRSILAIARQHGFTHVAVELAGARDEDERSVHAPVLRG